MKVCVISVCHDATHRGLHRLNRSLLRHGWTHTSIIKPWRGFKTKLISMRDFVPRAREEGFTHLLHTDAFDTMFFAGQEELEAKLKQIGYDGTGAVLSCEKASWPDPELAKFYPPNPKSVWCHINSGQYLVNVDYVETLLDGCDDCVDDQLFLTQKYLADQALNPEPKILRDDGCLIFQSLAHANPWHETFEVVGDHVLNKVTNTHPIAIHASGGGSSSNYHSWLPNFND